MTPPKDYIASREASYVRSFRPDAMASVALPLPGRAPRRVLQTSERRHAHTYQRPIFICYRKLTVKTDPPLASTGLTRNESIIIVHS